MHRALLVSLVGCLVAACPSPGPSGRGATVTTPKRVEEQPPDAAPRLVVLVVVDQLPEWAFEAKRTALTGGFGRLLSEGEWRVGRHPSIATLTAPGHALLGTGHSPATSGIVANEWWSREAGKTVKATEGEDGGTSSRFLRVPGLGDAVLAAGRGGKAVGIALKNRAARLVLGHHGLAIYYNGKAGTWSSHGASTVPGAPPPSWLANHDRAHPVAKRLAPWVPLDPARLAQLSGTVDAQTGEVGEKGFGPTFPHDPARTKYATDAVFAMPLGNDLVLDMGIAAIAGEQLGADRVPDLLVVSLSAHDYVAHGWGHESWEAWDAALRLDARLATFLDELDRDVGRGRWAMVVTSDHGGSPLPERLGGGRYSFEQVQRAANQAASLELGPGEWIASAQYPTIYLTPAALAKPAKDLRLAIKKIVFALRSFPGLALVDRSDAYMGGCDQRTGDAHAICLALDPERSGEVVYIPAPGWVMEEEAERLATAHGSVHDYDRLVPVLLAPFGRVPHAPQTTPGSELPVSDIAPLLKTWLGETTR